MHKTVYTVIAIDILGYQGWPRTLCSQGQAKIDKPASLSQVLGLQNGGNFNMPPNCASMKPSVGPLDSIAFKTLQHSLPWRMFLPGPLWSKRFFSTSP